MGSSHSSRRKPTSSSFKSTVATPPPKSTSAKVSLNSRSQSPASSPPTTTPTASESPKVTVEKVSPADGVPRNSHEKPIEVSERSPVSEPGTHPEFPTPSLEEVRKVTTTELKSTRKSTDSARDTKPKTERSTSSKVPAWESESDQSSSENHFSSTTNEKIWNRLTSNPSIPPPNSDTVDFRPSKKRGSSWDHSRRKSLLPSVSTTKQLFENKASFKKRKLFKKTPSTLFNNFRSKQTFDVISFDF